MDLVRVLPLSLSLSLLVGGCAGARAPSRPPPTVPRPRLVVLVVYDQLASWVLAEHAAELDDEGAIRWLERSGLHVERARYAYAGTLTAPGHAAIVSGAGPDESGVPSNRVWDRRRRARVSSFDDGEHPVFGHEGAFGGAGRLRARTVADALVEATSGRARVVALAMKDRGAIPPGGHHPTLTLWFDGTIGAFTSSTAFVPALPPWVEAFRLEHPVAGYVRPWTPLRAYDALGPDEQPGEGGYGFGASFPHDPTGTGDAESFLALPGSTEMLLDLAERAVVEVELGQDEITDFLSISVASTDYVGHAYGPDSWEYRDMLIRSDLQVGRFLTRLAARTDLAVLLTSDHGIAPLVERHAEHGLPAGVRWTSAELLPGLEAHLASTLGPREGGYIDAWVVPHVTFTTEVRQDAALRARTADVAEAYLLARPGVGSVTFVAQAAALRRSDDDVVRATGLSITDDPPGDLYVLPSRGSVADDVPGDTGTSHGSAFDYDREVPVLVRGPGITPGRTTTTVAQDRVAATLAHLLGVPPVRPGAAPLVAPE